MKNLPELLQGNSYPGRGIVVGKNEKNEAIIAYFIMGRSGNSRNRVFIENDGGICTQAADPAKLEDPSLIIYAPVRKINGITIVTNGDQTDTIYETIKNNGSFEDALRKRTFEPDAPNYTPRISAILKPDFSYTMSILKSANGNPEAVQRFFYEYDGNVLSTGHFIHTYQQDSTPLPSFCGEPVPVCLQGSLKEIGDSIWESLHNENRVALFVRSFCLDANEETLIYNKFNKI